MKWVLDVALAGLAVALCLNFVRILRGPTAHDRVVGLDSMSTTVVGLVGVYAIRREQAVLLDVLMVIALLGFISTVAIARYLERGAQQ